MAGVKLPPVNYDTIAPTYDSRYVSSDLTGVARALLRLARRLQPARVLEAGCGTGHWLAKLGAALPEAQVVGLDLSAGMLAQAGARRFAGQAVLRYELVRGSAPALPFMGGAIDLVYCVNAIHHFPEPEAFIQAAQRALRPGGMLFIANMDPHTGTDVWTVYDYFPGTLGTDLRRCPSMRQVRGWMRAAGFTRVRTRPVERIERDYHGAQVFADPILGRLGTSQLALLSDKAYAAGIDRLRAEIESGGEHPPRFLTHLTLWGTVGYIKNFASLRLGG